MGASPHGSEGVYEALNLGAPLTLSARREGWGWGGITPSVQFWSTPCVHGLAARHYGTIAAGGQILSLEASAGRLADGVNESSFIRVVCGAARSCIDRAHPPAQNACKRRGVLKAEMLRVVFIAAVIVLVVVVLPSPRNPTTTAGDNRRSKSAGSLNHQRRLHPTTRWERGGATLTSRRV